MYGVCHDTEVLEHTPYIEEILASFKFKVGVARLLFLLRAKIGEHTDSGHGWHLGLARLHIPIVTHENVIMMIDGERCQWRGRGSGLVIFVYRTGYITKAEITGSSGHRLFCR